jgi:anti-sigma B factor antagonist
VRLADVQFDTHERALVARITGEVDLSNAGEIGTAVIDAIPNDSLALVLELSDVDHLDSAGIQLIYRLREDLQARGQSLQLVIPRRSAAHDALRLAGVSRHIRLAETVEEAVAELAT